MFKFITALVLAIPMLANAGPFCDNLVKYKAIQVEGRAFTETEGFNVEDADGSSKFINTPEAAVSFYEPLCTKSKKRGVSYGMSSKAVLETTSWGAPERINTTYLKNMKHEQWVYSTGSMLYFDNDRLTGAQISR